MKKYRLLLAACLVLASMLLSTTSFALNLRFNVMFNAKHPLVREGFMPFAKEVKKVTNGRVKVTVFTSNALFKPKQAYDSIASRMADMGIIVATYQRNRRLLCNVMDLPMVAGEKAAVNSVVLQELFDTYPEMQKELKDVKVLWAYMNPAFQFHFSKKKVESLDGLKNMVISAGGQNQSRIVKSLGGSAEAMPMVDVYLALQKGVVEGCFLPYAPLRSQKIATLLKHHTNANLMAVAFFIAINQDAWAKISPEDQKAIQAISGLKASKKFGEIFDRAQVRDVKWMKKKGDTFYRLTPEQQEKWSALISPIRDEWVKDAKAKGHQNPEKILEKALQLMKEKSK
jgi:TRAP-type C4-dicarboxylate transport system substrate-binding protein